MKILYIHQYFNTPDLGGPTRSYWISKKLKEDGHDVFMLTTVGDKKVPKREIYKGINIINIHVPYSSEMGVLRRIKSFIQFMVLSSLHVLGKEKYDLIIATSTPLTVGVPALMSKKIKKRPYIFEVRDLWPEAPIQMGILTNKALIAITKWFEKAIYKNAKHIVALSPGMVKGVLETDVPKEKITMIPNMSKIDIFWPRKKKLSIIQELKLSPHSFKVVYFGSMGPTNGMDYIIDAAKLIGPEDNIEFLFFGGGPDENLLKERCRKEQIKNTRFYDDQPTAKLSEIVNFCDVSLVTFANFPILNTNSPNKFFDSLSAGIPIIVNSPGWTKEIVEHHQCGLFSDPLSSKDLAQKITFLKNNPDTCKKMGENSRKLAETKYDKSILCAQFAQLVKQLSNT